MGKDGAHRSKAEFMLGPSSGVKLTSDTDIPGPPPCNCSASRSGGWEECALTNNWFSRLEADLLAGKGLSEVGIWRPWCSLVKMVRLLECCPVPVLT